MTQAGARLTQPSHTDGKQRQVRASGYLRPHVLFEHTSTAPLHVETAARTMFGSNAMIGSNHRAFVMRMEQPSHLAFLPCSARLLSAAGS